jgi:hypothetical protein
MAISKKMQDMINKGVAASKDFASKAGAKAKDLGAMGMLKIEILQLHSREDKLTMKLGGEVYKALMEKNDMSVSGDSPVIGGILKEIQGLRSAIAEKEKEYRAIGGKVTDLKPVKTE